MLSVCVLPFLIFTHHIKSYERKNFETLFDDEQTKRNKTKQNERTMNIPGRLLRFRGVYQMRPKNKNKARGRRDRTKTPRFRVQFSFSRFVVVHIGVFYDLTTAAHAWDIVSWTYRRCISHLNDPDPKRTAVYDRYAESVRNIVSDRLRSRVFTLSPPNGVGEGVSDRYRSSPPYFDNE